MWQNIKAKCRESARNLQLFPEDSAMCAKQSPHAHNPAASRPRTLETIALPRPRCPRCGSPRLTKYRSIADQGDGTALAWVKCHCGHRFRLLLE